VGGVLRSGRAAAGDVADAQPAYEYLNKFIAVEITSTVRHIDVEVMLGKAEGLPKTCVANFDNLHTVPANVLTKRIGRLSAVRQVEAKRALGQALHWPELALL
jgi:mRNA-degrading endonuclease toxin of MazEF toxin-antitoxin module